MVPQRVIEGTGEEIARYAQTHPKERFQLIVLSSIEQPKRPRGKKAFKIEPVDLGALPGMDYDRIGLLIEQAEGPGWR